MSFSTKINFSGDEELINMDDFEGEMEKLELNALEDLFQERVDKLLGEDISNTHSTDTHYALKGTVDKYSIILFNKILSSLEPPITPLLKIDDSLNDVLLPKEGLKKLLLDNISYQLLETLNTEADIRYWDDQHLASLNHKNSNVEVKNDPVETLKKALAQPYVFPLSTHKLLRYQSIFPPLTPEAINEEDPVSLLDAYRRPSNHK